jgi:hypothetical protein
MLIAITASSYKITGNNHLWCNGITQNAFFLGVLLEKMGHTAYIIHNDVPKLRETPCLPPCKIIDIAEIFNFAFDVIISLGHTLLPESDKKYRQMYPNCKFVLYICGNTFIHTVETIIFRDKDHSIRTSLPKYDYDQIWVIPQMERTSIDFLRFYYNNPNVTVVPFIWSPYIGQEFLKETGQKEYEGEEIKSIAVLEPNLSVAKHFLFPLMVVEEYVRRDEPLEYFYIMCADRFRANRNLLETIQGSELVKQKKISVEHRYPTLAVLNKWAQGVISFQWENPLNYLYLDVAWYGWPIIHNADFCQDIGYYYHGFDVQEGVTAMKCAIQNHAKDTGYKQRMRDLLRRYTDENPNLLSDYDMLFSNVLTGKFVKYKYNWRLNSISEV